MIRNMGGGQAPCPVAMSAGQRLAAGRLAANLYTAKNGFLPHNYEVLNYGK